MNRITGVSSRSSRLSCISGFHSLGRGVMESKTFLFIVIASFITALALPAQLAAQQSQYKLIDIGTLGGPQSYINPPNDLGSPNQVNASSIAVGGADLPIPHLGPCFGPDPSIPFVVIHAFQSKNGVITDLGSLGGVDHCSAATSINARGLIAGNSENDVLDPILGGNELRAVIWENGEIHDLGTFGGNASLATGVNNRGQVVGLASTSNPDPFSILYFQLGGVTTGTQTQAFLWQNGHMRNLGTLGGPDAAAFNVNNRGQVAGGSYTNDIPNATTGFPTLHPFLWESGRMIDLGTLGGTAGGPIALNNRGQVLGISNLAGDQSADFFLWENGKLTDLTAQSSGGTLLLASSINDAGQIIGGASFPGRDFDAAVWQNGVLTDLGTLDGDCYSFADAINSRGQIVGSSYSCDGSTTRAFLWQNGSISDLNELIPADSGLQLAGCPPDNICPSIFDNGDISGFGIVPGSGCSNAVACGTAFLLQPSGTIPAMTSAKSVGNRTPPSAGRSFQEIMTQIGANTGRQRRLPGIAPVRGAIHAN
jgi:probable HAF family extracellular repeat protein